MHFTSYFVVLTLAAATASAATTHQVAVGQNGLRYTPNVTYADVGDTVVFTFYPRNHNVVQGSFDTPCMSDSTGGIHSGFIPSTIGAANRTFQVTINDTNPIWFYCSQNGHCTAGMVGVINPPNTTDMTLVMYAAGAAQVSNTSYTTPLAVAGGVVVLNTTANASGSAMGSNSSATSTGGAGANSTTSSIPTQATPKSAAVVLHIERWGFGAVACGLALALL